MFGFAYVPSKDLNNENKVSQLCFMTTGFQWVLQIYMIYWRKKVVNQVRLVIWLKCLINCFLKNVNSLRWFWSLSWTFLSTRANTCVSHLTRSCYTTVIAKITRVIIFKFLWVIWKRGFCSILTLTVTTFLLINNTQEIFGTNNSSCSWPMSCIHY